MKSLVALTVSLLSDYGNLYTLDVSRDIRTVTHRAREEGDPFLTITMDGFRVAFEAALEAGTWADIVIPGFRKDGSLPAFMRGMIARVFQKNGLLRDLPDVSAIRAVRQICGIAAKMRTECDPRYTARALEDFVSTDARATARATPELKAVFSALFLPVLRAVSDRIRDHSLPVKHGDGASAERLLPNSRWRFPRWSESMEEFFPSMHYAYLNPRHFLAEGEALIHADETEPVRVQFVPKTAKGPRTIAIEPSWRMYAQQGILGVLVEEIERRGLPPRFTDATANRDAAREGSVSRLTATIDLSAASDSVSSGLVWDLLGCDPYFRGALFACRSSQALLPDGTTLVLEKFASMGSAACFPIEAMVFAAISVLAISEIQKSGYPSLPLKKEVTDRVIVFGDDIIIPASKYDNVVAHLEAFGFQVNVKKSFVKGFFRESCGADWYAGHDVSYVKVRQPLRFATTSAVETVSTVSLRNALAATGLWPATVEALDRALVRGLRLFPHGSSASSGLVRTHTPYGVCASVSIDKIDRNLQRPVVKAWTQVSEFKEDRLDGWAGMHKSIRLMTRRNGPSWVPTSYETAGRSVRARLIARWVLAE